MAALWVTLGLLAVVFAVAVSVIDMFSPYMRRGHPTHVNTEVNGYVNIHTGAFTPTRYPVKGPPP